MVLFIYFLQIISPTHIHHSSIINERLVDDQNQAFQSMTVVKSVITLVELFYKPSNKSKFTEAFILYMKIYAVPYKI